MSNAATLRRITTITSAALGLVAAVVALPAAAQPNVCGQRAQFVEMLSKRFAEAPVSMGLATNGNVVEVFSATDGSSWTLLVTTPDGRSCMAASGESWMPVAQVSGQVS